MGVRVKIFDEEHEEDLETKINDFLEDLDEQQLVDIKYQLSTFYDYKDQIYCYSAMIIYKERKEEEDDE
ncbi:sporulation protein Cse60 [Mycoplasmatota bacterium]|nr:sporulation protein Cse60 [Mycoplasmatota bacterium]